LEITSHDLRRRTWTGLRRWIELWLRNDPDETNAALAIPSVPYVANSESLEFLVSLIERGSARIAWAAALGAMDWASGNCPSASSLDESGEKRLADAALARIGECAKEVTPSADLDFDLRATLLWLIGATVSAELLPVACQLIVQSFLHPIRTEDAAALKAARLVVARFDDHAYRELAAAFGGFGSSAFFVFWSTFVAPSHR